MTNHPTINQLLLAVRSHLEKQVVPALDTDDKLHDQTVIALDMLRMIERELQFGSEYLREEWTRLDFVQGVTMPIPDSSEKIKPALAERQRKLCEEINNGRYDFQPQQAALYEHLLLTTRRQLEVSNPHFLKTLALEEQTSG